MVILSKVTSLRVNSRVLGYLSLQPTHIKDSSVADNIMGKGSTHGVRVAITREDMRTDKRVDTVCM